MSFPRLLGLASAATALVLGLTACGGTNTASESDDGKINVVASTNVWGSVASAVGGDEVAVTSIIDDPSADPHSYETTPEDAVAAQNAQLTLANGGGYDDFFGKLADQAADARKLDAYEIGATGDENEHVWYSFATVAKVADQVATELGQIKPDAAQTFTTNATNFKSQLDQLTQKAGQIGTSHPDTKVLVTEPVAHYLIDAAKVTDATPEEFSEAVEEETDVPPAALAEVNDLLNTKQVKTLINNEQTTTPVTEQVVATANTAGIPVVGVTETLPAGTSDYIAWMTSEVDDLAKALNS
ncbi:zinc ABC transporter substrate-binding protein [Amycolatopsis endophytica]|uniref:Zinc/manganese transport system substrate-binding protein n=1 Tax=Amycolatopsis endophytica TaxID=860233 RepID=A0A853B2I0_9PSEU|nr:zinc ABC transporter substrate-binding protein [Amycolatopsis endophytica]NYI89062.1 zinc/manganese transport system substrate-binding protein [Amycolatopsis endophytica]